jgi:NADH-quinone oxidoreductase subunit D
VTHAAATGDRLAGGPVSAERRTLRLGPAHPLTQGAAQLDVELDGETITGLAIGIGFGHRGFEKQCESGTWYQAIPFTDRIDPRSAPLANLAFCLAVEKLLDAAVPERGAWLRMLVAELARLADHWARIGALCSGLGAVTPAQYATAGGEIVRDLLEGLCGARVAPSYVRIGGVRHDAPEGFADGCRAGLEGVRGRIAELDGMLTRNRLLVDRLRDTGVLSQEDCLRHAVTGPVLRAAGVPLDLRKDAPYLCYDRVDFDVPVGEVGDNFDRLLVCFEEMRQSASIAEQCLAALDALGGRAVDVDDPHVRWPAKGRVFDRLEEMIAHFKGVIDGPRVPAGEAYAAVESANGELGFYLVSDGSGRPSRVRCRPPSLLNLASLERMMKGAPLADLVPTWHLLNVASGECDR